MIHPTLVGVKLTSTIATFSDLDRQAVTTARLLAADAIEDARSGHPGAALSLAPVAHLLFQRYLRHDPSDPEWAGRDRFVLSCGHASMLLYAQLYLTGYDLTLEDLKNFRRLGSRTPGHPERGVTPGVEATTGPLGQGFAMAVGLAMAFQHDRAMFDALAARGKSPFDRRVWVLVSDGDLEEGISYEAGALAGHHRLDNLTVIYDRNGIQIEGKTDLAWSEDVAGRFASQGWFVSTVARAADGDIDVDALARVLDQGAPAGFPHLIIVDSEIAWPAPNARGTSASHGAPLGPTEVAALRRELGVTRAPWTVARPVLEFTRQAVRRGTLLHESWNSAMEAWRKSDSERAEQWQRALDRTLPERLIEKLPVFEKGSAMSTRDASGQTIQRLASMIPELVGGSADLAEPNRASIAGGGDFLPGDIISRRGRNIHWGVREHGMAAAMNGMLLAGGTRAFAGTFLVFSDYERPAIRLAALMGLPAIYLWTHDSIALGQDGPTHQPVEQLASLRAMPGLTLIRPADANETVAAWATALEESGPVGLVLCRQGVPVLDVPRESLLEGVRRGAYVVSEDEGPDVCVVATGSEVELALKAARVVRQEGIRVRVVSMPSRELFLRQSMDYRERVLSANCPARVVVEAATSFGWADIVGDEAEVISLDHFGLSAPAEEALQSCGFTVDRVAQAIRRVRK